MNALRLPLALAALAFASTAAAEDGPLTVDLVAMVVGGFADGASVQVSPEPVVVARTAPGTYSGTTQSGQAQAMTVVESSPCLFDLTFAVGDESFDVRLDMGLVQSIAFESAGDMGLAEGIAPYAVKFTATEGFAVRPLADGTVEALSSSPSIATSVPVAELQAAATQLGERCPAR